jgi:hypothetical protein
LVCGISDFTMSCLHLSFQIIFRCSLILTPHNFDEIWESLTISIYLMSSATVFLGYLRGTLRYIRSHLISAVDFYCVINKLIILVPEPH